MKRIIRTVLGHRVELRHNEGHDTYDVGVDGWLLATNLSSREARLEAAECIRLKHRMAVAPKIRW